MFLLSLLLTSSSLYFTGMWCLESEIIMNVVTALLLPNEVYHLASETKAKYHTLFDDGFSFLFFCVCNYHDNTLFAIAVHFTVQCTNMWNIECHYLFKSISIYF